MEPVRDLEAGPGADEEIELVALSIDDLDALRAAVLLAEEALGKALAAVTRHEGADGHLAQEIGSALAALATTEDDLRRVVGRPEASEAR